MDTNLPNGLLVFLVAAGIFVPLFHRARIGTVPSFLLIGLILGPFGIGLFNDLYPWVDNITFENPVRAEPLAQLGIIFLLFLIGLDLSIERLWQLRRYVFGVGLFQVVGSTFAIAAILRLGGFPATVWLVVGMSLALSSTAIVMQILAEQQRSASTVGHAALSVLLFQDLMVVPILFIVGALSNGGEGALKSTGLVFGLAIGTVLIIMVAGHFLVRPLMRSAGRTGSRELLMAITLLIVVAVSWATAASGLSAALGAFLAGLLLSATEYRHQVEVDIEPFKGLLLGIFFVTVGASIDLTVVASHLILILGSLAVMLVVKTAVLFLGARLFGVTRASAIELALLLAPAGEFAFVVLGIAGGSNLLPEEVVTSAIAIAGLSMMVTPLLATLGRRVAARWENGGHVTDHPDPETSLIERHVVICGFGTVGQIVACVLEGANVPFVCIDTNGETVAHACGPSRRIIFGDASRIELLERAGGSRAAAFVITSKKTRTAERIVEAVRCLQPKALVFAGSRGTLRARRVADMDAVGAVREEIETSFMLAAQVLKHLDLTDDTIVPFRGHAR